MRLASEFDFLILEDDPYFHLTLSESTTDGSVRPPSLRSLDTEGRVIRFESLSKVLSAGMRLGWVTGHPKLVERVNLHMQCSSLHTSGVSQVLAYTLFKEWGVEGLCSHIAQVQQFYTERRDAFVAAAQRQLTGLASWSVPKAGMFC